MLGAGADANACGYGLARDCLLLEAGGRYGAHCRPLQRYKPIHLALGRKGARADAGRFYGDAEGDAPNGI